VSPRERAAREISRSMPEDAPVINRVFCIFSCILFLFRSMVINEPADSNGNGAWIRKVSRG